MMRKMILFSSLVGWNLNSRVSMTLNGYTLSSGATQAFPHKSETCSSRSPNSAVSGLPHLPIKVRSFCSRSPLETFPRVNSSASFGVRHAHLSAVPTPLLHREKGSLFQTMSKLPKRRQLLLPVRASKDVPTSYKFPPMTKKPRWWWRTLACIPYLMPFHETWMYAETAYHLHPFLEDFEFMTYPFLRSIGRLPSWSLMAYFFIAYLGIVRRKEWPHFFRFHVIMGMLLEIALQVVGTVSRWMPAGLYWGKIGMHVWTAIAFGYLFTVVECIICALSGKYADVPFACDAAYIQMPYD